MFSMQQSSLAFTDADGWHPSIGDPSLMGWVTVGAYFVAACLCFRASRAPTEAGPEKIFWQGLAAILFFLAINKQLDLQTAFTLVFKRLAQAQGWYEQRRIVQAAFIVMIGLGGLAITVTVLWKMRRTLKRKLLAIAGVMFLGLFIIIRASSFHYVDQMLGLRLGGLKLNWILELSGIACIIVATLPFVAKGGVILPPPRSRSLPTLS